MTDTIQVCKNLLETLTLGVQIVRLQGDYIKQGVKKTPIRPSV